MKLSEVKIGHSFVSPRHGNGMITKVTKRTVTAVFENECTSKVTYKHVDSYFNPCDF